MKKFALCTLALSSALTLTACGGSDDNDSPSVIATGKPSTPIVQPNYNANAKITGEVLVDDDYVTSVSSNNINQLTVNGRTFNLDQSNAVSGGFTNINNRLIVSGTHMKYAKYGMMDDWQGDNDYLFYQGEKTPVANTPTTGVAHYVGRSIYTCDNCNDRVITGESILAVDFSNKTLTGSINNSYTSVPLSATISGNTFSGVNNAGTGTRGAFFGDNAQEISGVYQNDHRDFEGAFGATKQ